MSVALAQTLTKRGFQNPTMPFVCRTDDAGRPRVFDARNGVFSESLLRKCRNCLVNNGHDSFRELWHLRPPSWHSGRLANSESVSGEIKRLQPQKENPPPEEGALPALQDDRAIPSVAVCKAEVAPAPQPGPSRRTGPRAFPGS